MLSGKFVWFKAYPHNLTISLYEMIPTTTFPIVSIVYINLLFGFFTRVAKNILVLFLNFNSMVRILLLFFLNVCKIVYYLRLLSELRIRIIDYAHRLEISDKQLRLWFSLFLEISGFLFSILFFIHTHKNI